MLHQVGQTQLSTDEKSGSCIPVDESAAAAAVWLGLVVPKRHARRSVTRNLVRRQMRACFARHAHALPSGDWVLRLRKGYERAQFPSAASDALAEVVARELAQLMERARRSTARAPAAAAATASVVAP
jgi:ribonuclease P protein component